MVQLPSSRRKPPRPRAEPDDVERDDGVGGGSVDQLARAVLPPAPDRASRGQRAGVKDASRDCGRSEAQSPPSVMTANMRAAPAVAPTASRAVTVKLADPKVVDVPVRLPVAESDRPRGSEPEATDQAR